MNAKTLKALKGSIAKWRKIVAGKEFDAKSENCPLCILFTFSCEPCPVARKTKQHECRGTPYDTEWLPLGGAYKKASTPKLKKAARAELSFLKSLLPRVKK